MASISKDEIIQYLRDLNSAFDNFPISSDHKYYFNFYEAPGNPRGSDSALALKSLIDIEELNGSSAQLFSGYRGTGKSSELLRLKSMLEKENYKVLFIKGLDYINENEPLEVTDFLISVGAGVADACESLTGKAIIKEGFFKQVQNFFQNFAITDFSFNFDWVSFKLKLKRDVRLKHLIQERLNNDIINFVEKIQEFLISIKEYLNSEFGLEKSPIIIVDDLEKIRGTSENEDLVFRSVERLFSYYDWALKFPGWHFIWTVPPYIEIMNATIPTLFDGWTLIPMVRLWHIKEGNQVIDYNGIDALKKLILKRGDTSRILDEEGLEKVILASSGNVRELLTLMRNIIIKVYMNYQMTNNLSSISTGDINTIINEYYKTIQNSIYTSDYDWLKKVANGNEIFIQDEGMIQRVAKLIDTSIVMIYRNEDRWYDVHSGVRELFSKAGI